MNKKSKKPLIISGGGVFYSGATDELSSFAIKHNIPVTQTVMGYSTMKRDHSHYAGQIGGLGGKNTNDLAKETDLAIAIGTKLGDFTTGSWSNFENPLGHPFILSGGLNQNNIIEAINLTGTEFIDINSGVEEIKGEKNELEYRKERK